MHQHRPLMLFMALVIMLAVGTFHPAVSADEQALIAEYSKSMGFAQGQVLDASIGKSGIMKISIDECSFCGAFKNEDSRNRIARSTLQWFLSKTGNTTGTVEWYNRAQVKIMAISGSPKQSNITSGLPCAIKQQ